MNKRRPGTCISRILEKKELLITFIIIIFPYYIIFYVLLLLGRSSRLKFTKTHGQGEEARQNYKLFRKHFETLLVQKLIKIISILPSWNF